MKNPEHTSNNERSWSRTVCEALGRAARWLFQQEEESGMAILAIKKAPKAKKNKKVVEKRPETPEERYRRILATAKAYGLFDPEEWARRDIEIGLPGSRKVVGYVPAATYPESPEYRAAVRKVMPTAKRMEDRARRGILFTDDDTPG